jgi:transcriptional repressor NrdR
VVKRDNTREEYSRDKLYKGLVLACTKRPVPADLLEEAANDIEAQLFSLGTSEVPSTTIGELVMQKLRELDEVAYIRFASVYRNFADLEEMREAMEGLTGHPPAESQASSVDQTESKDATKRARG